MDSFTVTSDAVATGCAASTFDTKTGDNVYKLKIIPHKAFTADDGQAVDYAVSQSNLSKDD